MSIIKFVAILLTVIISLIIVGIYPLASVVVTALGILLIEKLFRE